MSFRRQTRPLRRALARHLLQWITSGATATSPAAGAAFGAWLGRLLPRVWPREARRSIENLGHVCGPIPAVLRRPLRAGLAHALGGNLVAMARTLGAARAVLPVAAQGLDRLDAACAGGGGAVIVSAHCGPWEALAPALAAAGYRVALVVRPLRDPAVDAMLRSARHHAGVQLFVRGASSAADMVDWVRQGGVLGIVLDQAPRGRSTEATWWGRSAQTAVGPAWIAVRAGAPLWVATVSSAPSPRRHPPAYALRIDGPVAPEPTSPHRDLRRTTRCLTRVLDAQLRQAPLEWVWFHEREPARH